MSAGSTFSLRLLGGFALERDGRACPATYEKGRALFAYLAIESGRAHPRSALSTLLWPDLPRKAALANLRQVLHRLRLEVDPAGADEGILRADRDTVEISPDARLSIDAERLMEPLPECRVPPGPAACASCMARLEEIAGEYRGEFMAGLSVDECPDFEDWLSAQREASHLRALLLLTQVSECHERLGDVNRALVHALRFAELEPWNEAGLRRVMRLLAAQGQRAAALARYETCCRALRRELGVSPSEETLALAERIRAGGTLQEDSDGPKACVDAAPRSEKRQVTAVYCELSVLDADDPEDALMPLLSARARCDTFLRDGGGHPVRIHDGGILAYFGYPRASENAARRAVRAALAVVGETFDGLAVRVGIHTGIIVCGDDAVPDPIGMTSTRAIQARQSVGDGEVAVTDATRRLIAGYFDCLPVSPANAGGVFLVGGASGAEDRVEASDCVSPLIGRERELASLCDEWRNVGAGGMPRAVLLRGVAGIGKTRLAKALARASLDAGYAEWVLRCREEYRLSPFHPLESLFGLSAPVVGEAASMRYRRLLEHVEAAIPGAGAAEANLLAKALAIPVCPPEASPDAVLPLQRERVIELMIEFLRHPAATRPLLVVIEDLHWADPSTLELLRRFLTQPCAGSVLVVMTARPEFSPESLALPVRDMSLAPLCDGDTARLIRSLAPDIAPARLSCLVDRADGVPLFAEELARDTADCGSAVPGSLRDLLVARLDTLGAARHLARNAAVIGRDIDLDLLRRVSGLKAEVEQETIRTLREAGVLESGACGSVRFRHALIRDAAYEMQTRDERMVMHRRVAAALADGGENTRHEVLAEHWVAGGMPRLAVAAWLKAGRQSVRDSACQEARAHFRAGLRSIGELPPGSERVRLELELQIGLGTAACAADGYGSADGAAAYERVVALCTEDGNDPKMFPALWGLWASASSRLGYDSALALARRLVRLAERSGDPVHAQQACFAVADTLYWQGRFAESRDYLSRVRAMYRPDQHERHVAEFGEDGGVTGAAYDSWVAWFLGLPEQAERGSNHSVALARRLGHAYSLAYALTFAALLKCRLRQPEAAIELAEETSGLARKHGFALWQVGASLAKGWAEAQRGDCRGVEVIERCVEATRAAMGGVALVALGPLAEARVACGRHEEALSTCVEALELGARLGDRHIEAEIRRLMGEAMLGAGGPEAGQAEKHFLESLAICRTQGAMAIELRAATSLSRLWHAQGRSNDALRLLDEVYSRFDSPVGTPDHEDARALRDVLRKAHSRSPAGRRRRME